jgi:2-beta-glucuronyltransferase
LKEQGKSIVFVSAVHDYRMLRRGSIQSLGSATARNGHAVTFISLRFSLLSLIKKDSRGFLWRKSNKPELIDGVVCYLWFTLIHPFQARSRLFNVLFRPYYFIHRRLRNSFVDDSFRSADYIVIESGQGILYAERARRLNPRAKIIYRASDKLSTIGAAGLLQTELERTADVFDWFCLLSAGMADDFAWARDRCFLLPLGVDPEEFQNTGPNPYTAPINAISVGSMLFDASFFETAANLFPDVQFHVIGCGTSFEAPANVTIYDEMAFRDTLRYIEFASFGIAPYRATVGAEYLGTSSLKLKQYEHFGIPAACPFFAVGQSLNRFGYEPGDTTSIKNAIMSARSRRFVPVPPPPTWRELAEQMLGPSRFTSCDLRQGVRGCVKSTDVQLDEGQSEVAIVSLVTCTLGDRKAQLVRLLKSLVQQTFGAFELIVVDQNPPGYLDEILQSCGAELCIKHMRSSPGLSVGRNVGLAVARGRIVGFPDDDCWYVPDTLARVVDFFDLNGGIGVLLGRTVDEVGRPSLSPCRSQSGTVDKGNVWTSGNSNTLFVRRDAARATSGFDENIGVGAPTRFQSGEETDFVLALIEAGVRAIYVEELKVCHDQVEGGKLTRSLRRAWMYSQGFGYVLKKHRFGIVYVVYRFGRSILSAARAMLRFHESYGLSRVAWGIGTLVGYAMARTKG